MDVGDASATLALSELPRDLRAALTTLDARVADDLEQIVLERLRLVVEVLFVPTAAREQLVHRPAANLVAEGVDAGRHIVRVRRVLGVTWVWTAPRVPLPTDGRRRIFEKITENKEQEVEAMMTAERIGELDPIKGSRTNQRVGPNEGKHNRLDETRRVKPIPMHMTRQQRQTIQW